MVDGAFGNCRPGLLRLARGSWSQATIADELVERLRGARRASITVGPGRDDRDLGPLVSDEQHDKVTRLHRRGASARRAARRSAAAGPTDLHARLLRRADHLRPTSTPAAAHRARGGVRPGRDDHPLRRPKTRRWRIANGLGYGLVAGVYTRDISRALRLAQRLEAGSVWINGWFIGGQQAPTGGIKDSGIGRERGLPGMRNYLQIKNVGIRL